MEDAFLRFERFKDISLEDPFFASLKADYAEFGDWFRKKGDHQAFTFRDDKGGLDGFLYLKVEDGPVLDTVPPLPAARRLKIGTFKVNPHGTRLGERFIKRAFDVAVDQQVAALYVTIFEKHTALVELFRRYGFIWKAHKHTANGEELVLERRLDAVAGDVVLDYPRIPLRKDRHFILSLYPEWHSRLLPDSLLKTESSSILEDVSHTNSIHKIYLAGMRGVEQLQRGDTLLIYRTAEGGSAEYTSVVTSLCVVEELRSIDTFRTVEEFLAYCAPYSIFSETELRNLYERRKYPWVIRFTYNLALRKRPNRKAIIEEAGIDRKAYPGLLQISKQQLRSILKLSGDYEKARSLVYTP
jgi:GNAT superfamily N-acetyltransferase